MKKDRSSSWRTWVFWLGKQRILMSCESSSSSSSNAQRWQAWPSRISRQYPDGFLGIKYSRKYLRKSAELMQGYLGFMYTSDPWGRSPPNFCSLLAAFKIRIGGRNCLSALQQSITVTYSPPSTGVRTSTSLIPFLATTHHLLSEYRIQHWNLLRYLFRSFLPFRTASSILKSSKFLLCSFLVISTKTIRSPA